MIQIIFLRRMSYQRRSKWKLDNLLRPLCFAFYILNAACTYTFIYTYLVAASKTFHGTGIPPPPFKVQTPPFSYVQPFPLRCPKPPSPPMSKPFPLQCPNPSHFLCPTLRSPWCLTLPPLRCPHPSPSSVQTLSYSYVQPLPPHYVQLYSCDVQTLPLLNKNVNKQLPLYIPSQENNIHFMNLQKGFFVINCGCLPHVPYVWPCKIIINNYSSSPNGLMRREE